MAFSKFDPHRPDDGRGPDDPTSEAAARRAMLLRYGWWVSVVYTAVGFGFIAYWLLR